MSSPNLRVQTRLANAIRRPARNDLGEGVRLFDISTPTGCSRDTTVSPAVTGLRTGAPACSATQPADRQTVNQLTL